MSVPTHAQFRKEWAQLSTTIGSTIVDTIMFMKKVLFTMPAKGRKQEFKIFLKDVLEIEDPGSRIKYWRWANIVSNAPKAIWPLLLHDNAHSVVGLIGWRSATHQKSLMADLVNICREENITKIAYDRAKEACKREDGTWKYPPVCDIGRRTNRELLADFLQEMQELRDRIEQVEARADLLGNEIVEIYEVMSTTEAWETLPDLSSKASKALSADQKLRLDTAYAYAMAMAMTPA